MASQAPKPERQIGRSTRALQKAPRGAVVFIPSFSSKKYFESLAARMDRGDLEFVSLGVASPEHFLSRVLSGVVVDHACFDRLWTKSEHEAVAAAYSAIKPRETLPPLWARDGRGA